MLSAFSRLPRSLKGMYLHAFQSYMWNHAASHRLRRYGLDGVVAGDLVIRADAKDPDLAPLAADPLGAAAEGATGDECDMDAAEDVGAKEAHVVTEAEAEGGVYSVDDIVLPMAGPHSRSYRTSDPRGRA